MARSGRAKRDVSSISQVPPKKVRQLDDMKSVLKLTYTVLLWDNNAIEHLESIPPRPSLPLCEPKTNTFAVTYLSSITGSDW